MQFAVILLIILAIACSLGSFIAQNQTYAWYAAKYSERAAATIIALHLDDLYHSWWFLIITAFLCLNLILCNIVRLPDIIKRCRQEKNRETILSGPITASEDGIDDPLPIFRKLGIQQPQEYDDGGTLYFWGSGNTAGYWGAWICHLGILLLILGFGLGQMTHQEFTVYGVPGETKQVADTGYAVTIDDFTVDLRKDDTVDQYIADITVRDLNNPDRTESATISVNHPAKIFGLEYIQNSTGWAAKVTVEKNGSTIQEQVVCAGDYLAVEDKPELVVLFNAFYPDYVFVPGSGPATMSSKVVNPGYLYSVYYQGEVIGMNVLTDDDVITIDDFVVSFSDPQNYTLIQIKHDRFMSLAFLGGITVFAGLALAFYIQPKRLWAVRGEDGNWTVSGYSRKAGVLIKEQLHTAVSDYMKSQK